MCMKGSLHFNPKTTAEIHMNALKQTYTEFIITFFNLTLTSTSI